jgi:hypothetical protein
MRQCRGHADDIVTVTAPGKSRQTAHYPLACRSSKFKRSRTA